MNNTKKTRPRSSRNSKATSAHVAPESIAPLLLTTEAAARLLSISPTLLRRLGREGEIPIVRVRSLVRFDAQDLSAWVARRKAQPARRRSR